MSSWIFCWRSSNNSAKIGKMVARSIYALLKKTPLRTFVFYPAVVLMWESLTKENLVLNPYFTPLMIWGYLEYRLVGRYRIKHGGGGPGLENPPERLVSTGPYAYSRNPMYLGHLIFLLGLTLTLHSMASGLITIGTAIWFHSRVLKDEKRLDKRLGKPYLEYKDKVKRWVPKLF